MKKISTQTITQLTLLSLFSRLRAADIEKLLSLPSCQYKSYKKSEVVLVQHQPYEVLHILLKGSIYGEMVRLSGKGIIVGFFKAPYCLAPGVLFSDKNLMPSTIYAKTDIEILTIPKESLLTFCFTNKTFLANFLRATSNTTAYLASKIYFMSIKTITSKLAHYLLAAEKTNNKITITFTMEELATFFGVARQSLYRALQKLQEAGILQKKKKELVILNRKRLMQLAE